MATPASAAEDRDGNWLYERCASSNYQRLTNCMAYMLGISDALIAAGLPGHCPADGGSAGQLQLVFLKYARSHPETLTQPQSTVAIASLLTAFPCRAASR